MAHRVLMKLTVLSDEMMELNKDVQANVCL